METHLWSSPSSGQITNVTYLNNNEALNEICLEKKEILVFIHGFDNSFVDAVKRAAFNQNWLSNANPRDEADNYTVILFTWPSQGGFSWDVFNDRNHYLSDQRKAGDSNTSEIGRAHV